MQLRTALFVAATVMLVAGLSVDTAQAHGPHVSVDPPQAGGAGLSPGDLQTGVDADPQGEAGSTGAPPGAGGCASCSAVGSTTAPIEWGVVFVLGLAALGRLSCPADLTHPRPS